MTTETLLLIRAVENIGILIILAMGVIMFFRSSKNGLSKLLSAICLFGLFYVSLVLVGSLIDLCENHVLRTQLLTVWVIVCAGILIISVLIGVKLLKDD